MIMRVKESLKLPHVALIIPEDILDVPVASG